MSLRKRLLRLLAVTILTPVVFLLGCQSQLIYHPSPYEPDQQAMLREAQGVHLAFTTSQGRQTAFYIPSRAASAGLPHAIWVCFGGNAALALDWLHLTDAWDDRFAYLLVDYPGYGLCEGNPNPGRIRDAGKAAIAALAAHLGATTADLQPQLAVLGHSLGCAAALMLAEDLQVRRGVLVSPFTSMTDMGRVVLGWPLCHLNLHRFDNRRTLARIAATGGVRFIVFHGAQDEIIPVRMGRELAAAHPGVVEFHEVPGAHHNDILGRIVTRLGQSMAALAP